MSVISADNDGLPVASTAEAEAGVIDNKTMTPLKTKQAIDYALSSSAVEILEGTVVWEPSSTTGVAISPNINVTGSVLGDFVDVAPPYDVQGMFFTGYVSDANTVNIVLTNVSGSTINLASGTWKVRVLPSVIVSPGAEVGATVPAALGVAAAGTSVQAARADHVHAMPSHTDVGAAAAAHTHAVSDTTGLQAILDGKAENVHTQAASTITDLAEAIDDRVNALMVAGQNMALAYNDVANTLTVSTTAAIVSSTAPMPLGPAAAGTSVEAARADHVHPLPLVADLGAAAAVHTHTASQVSDFAEAVDDRVNALLVAGSQIGIAYDDTANTLTISSSAPTLSSSAPQPLGTAAAGSAPTAARSDHVHAMPAVTDITGFAEAVDDRVATLVQAGPGVNVVYNDAANTLTVSAAGGSAQLGTSTPAPLGTASAGSGENASREDHVHPMPSAADVGAAPAVHTHTTSQVTDFAEAVDDRVNALLVQGANVTLTYDDTANTLTIASSGGTVGTATPQALGTAAAGTSLFSSREDHVHAMPTAVQVGAAPTVHTHAIADTTGLQAALDGKADDAHAHAIADVTGLQAALDGKADDAHTHAIADTTGLQAALDGKAASAHTHTASNITDFAEAVDDRVSALLVEGDRITLTYDDTANTLTVATTAAEVSDATPAALGVAAAGTAPLASRADHVHGMPSHTDVGAAAAVHTHSTTDITGFNEAVDDRVGAIIVAGSGSGITTTYDDGTATLTIGASVTATGTTTSRSLPNRFSDRVSVRDFGVVGDGSNEVVAIQAAIDAISTAGGGTLYFPPGNYGVQSTLTLKRGVVLEGCVTSGYFDGYDGYTSSVNTGSNCRIVALSSFTGFSNGGGSAAIIACEIGSWRNLGYGIRDVVLDCKGNTEYGIKAWDAALYERHLFLDNVSVTRAVLDGISISNCMVRARDCRFVANSRYGIAGAPVVDSYFSNTFVHSNGGGGVYANDGSVSVNFIGGKIEENLGPGMIIESLGSAAKMAVTGVTFQHNTYSAVKSVGAVAAKATVNLVGCQFNSNGYAQTLGAGAQLWSSGTSGHIIADGCSFDNTNGDAPKYHLATTGGARLWARNSTYIANAATALVYNDGNAANALFRDNTLYANHTATSKTDADTTETTLRTIKIPGGLMGAHGSLRITHRWSVPNNATNKVLRVKFGGSNMQSITVTTSTSFIGEALISNRGVTNSQLGMLTGTTTSFGGSGSAMFTSTVDTTVAQDITFTGTWGAAGDGSLNITLESVTVEYLPG